MTLGSIFTASRSARASALKLISTMWWRISPRVQRDVQVALGAAREGLEEDRRELHVPRADLGAARQRHLPHEVRPARQIERAGDAGLVHRQRRPPVAHEAGLVAERLRDALADDQAQVFGRVVAVDLDVARGAHRQVDEAVPRDLLDHVRQERQRRVDLRAARPVEIERHLDARLLRLARQRRRPSHGGQYRARAPNRPTDRGSGLGSWCIVGRMDDADRAAADAAAPAARRTWAPRSARASSAATGGGSRPARRSSRRGRPRAEAFLVHEGRVRLLKRVAMTDRSLAVLKRGRPLRRGGAARGHDLRLDGRRADRRRRPGARPRDLPRPRSRTTRPWPSRVIDQLVRRMRDAEDQIEIDDAARRAVKVTSALLKLAGRADGRRRGDHLARWSSRRASGLDVEAVKRTVQRLRDRQYIRITRRAHRDPRRRRPAAALRAARHERRPRRRGHARAIDRLDSGCLPRAPTSSCRRSTVDETGAAGVIPMPLESVWRFCNLSM